MATARTRRRTGNSREKGRHLKKAPLRSGLKASARPLDASDTSLYLYGVAHQQRPTEPFLEEGIDSSVSVESLPCAGLACWVSRVSRAGFADKLSSNMENLDWLASAGVRHQRVVSELARRGAILPARFGTIFHSLESLERDISSRKRALIRSLARVADTDEWGIKVFLESRPEARAMVEAASGSDYLRRKAAALHDRMQQRSDSRKLSPEIQQLSAALDHIALEVATGGKVSAAQVGLEWQISILLPRGRQKQFSTILERFSRECQGQRRIECTGPWPPYSFVKL